MRHWSIFTPGLVVIHSLRAIHLAQPPLAMPEVVAFALAGGYTFAVLGLLRGSTWGFLLAALVPLFHIVIDISSNIGELHAGLLASSAALTFFANRDLQRLQGNTKLATAANGPRPYTGMELVPLASYPSSAVAHLVKNLLLAAGIPAYATGGLIPEEVPSVHVPKRLITTAWQVLESARRAAEPLPEEAWHEDT